MKELPFFCSPFPDEKPGLPFSGHGWLNPENRKTMEHLIKSDASKIVEIGTWMGLSARFMADLAPNATVYCVDTWLGSYEHLERQEWKEFLPTLWDQFVVDCWDYRDRIVPIKMDSIIGIEMLAADGIKPDVVYIDGGHRYDVVVNDIRTVMRLWSGSTIIGDDWGWDDVRRAVEELVPKKNLRVDNNCWWIEDVASKG